MKAVTWWKPLQSVIRTRHTGSHSAGISITSMPSSLWMPAGLTTHSTLQKSSESSAVKRKIFTGAEFSDGTEIVKGAAAGEKILLDPENISGTRYVRIEQ